MGVESKMKTASPILSEIQNQAFANRAELLVDGRDLNYKGFSLGNATGMVFSLKGTEAVKNKVMLWLVSSYGDYVREPEKGGPLENLLGKTLSDTNKEMIERSLSIAFTDFFQGDLTLAGATVTPDVTNKRWKIRLLVNDPVRRELFEIAVGVS